MLLSVIPEFSANYIYGFDAQSMPVPYDAKSCTNSIDGHDFIAKCG
jgi:hypothetical protein